MSERLYQLVHRDPTREQAEGSADPGEEGAFTGEGEAIVELGALGGGRRLGRGCRRRLSCGCRRRLGRRRTRRLGRMRTRRLGRMRTRRLGRRRTRRLGRRRTRRLGRRRTRRLGRRRTRRLGRRRTRRLGRRRTRRLGRRRTRRLGRAGRRRLDIAAGGRARTAAARVRRCGFGGAGRFGTHEPDLLRARGGRGDGAETRTATCLSTGRIVPANDAAVIESATSRHTIIDLPFHGASPADLGHSVLPERALFTCFRVVHTRRNRSFHVPRFRRGWDACAGCRHFSWGRRWWPRPAAPPRQRPRPRPDSAGRCSRVRPSCVVSTNRPTIGYRAIAESISPAPPGRRYSPPAPESWCSRVRWAANRSSRSTIRAGCARPTSRCERMCRSAAESSADRRWGRCNPDMWAAPASACIGVCGAAVTIWTPSAWCATHPYA
ncbi:hypothetical protein B7C42_00660 [Nocardia cerradoensis]|uniref:Uncharacterized protein n=1 Tax=Nocardia cerradoensis TaxID=85688 RepID=A0A231HFS7_9NOCA|nr:hypothetical protein B7C42_00660 [Nocardia cerradoensis]